LDPSEIRVARALGTARHNRDRKHGIVDRQVDIKTPDESIRRDALAMGAELALCKAWNLYPDLTTHPRHGGIDTRLHNGRTVDVKHTPHGWNLWFPTYKTLDGHADICVLVTGGDPDGTPYVIQGWAWTTDLTQERRIGRLPRREEPTYLMTIGELFTEIEDLPGVDLPPAREVPDLDLSCLWTSETPSLDNGSHST
jgi:hypothetical protein